jgi:hypothetical protein
VTLVVVSQAGVCRYTFLTVTGVFWIAARYMKGSWCLVRAMSVFARRIKEMLQLLREQVWTVRHNT